MAHRKAKLTVLGRRLLVDRILVDGMAVAHAADMLGVSRQTAWKCLRRFETEGEPGLEDRSSRPARSRRALPQAQVDAILAARHEHRYGPHRLAHIVGVARSTIGDVLVRHGLSRLRDQDGPSGIPIRYVRERRVSCSTSTSRSSAGSPRRPDQLPGVSVRHNRDVLIVPAPRPALRLLGVCAGRTTTTHSTRASAGATAVPLSAIPSQLCPRRTFGRTSARGRRVPSQLCPRRTWPDVGPRPPSPVTVVPTAHIRPDVGPRPPSRDAVVPTAHISEPLTAHAEPSTCHHDSNVVAVVPVGHLGAERALLGPFGLSG